MKSDQTLITRQDLEDLFDTLSIQAGSSICLQCSDAFCQQVIGKGRVILDVLMDKIGEGGCLFMPTFTPSYLDPSCKHAYPYEEWKSIREGQLGYHPTLSMSERESILSNQFLRYDEVLRTAHPVYSFAFWGFVDEKMLDQKFNYPLSFGHVLRPFAQDHAIELLLDVDPKESVLVPGIAKTLGLGTTILERAKIKKGKENTSRTYLSIQLDAQTREEALHYVYTKIEKLHDFHVFRLSLDEIFD